MPLPEAPAALHDSAGRRQPGATSCCWRASLATPGTPSDGAHGDEAFDQMAAGGLDLAFLDLNMPDMSGPDVIKMYRAGETGTGSSSRSSCCRPMQRRLRQQEEPRGRRQRLPDQTGHGSDVARGDRTDDGGCGGASRIAICKVGRCAMVDGHATGRRYASRVCDRPVDQGASTVGAADADRRRSDRRTAPYRQR